LSALQAAIAASPIDLDGTTKLVVEERRKSSKGGDSKSMKHIVNTERRTGGKSEDGRALNPKRATRGAAGSASPRQLAE